jgi:dihydroorotate dehydrogenase electron transfer subunit
LKILYNRSVAPGYFRMGIEWRTPGIRPGQFVMLRVAEGLDPLLRRPLGVYRVLASRGKGVFRGSGIEVLYKVVGRGTAILAHKRPGETVDVLGPLGNGFPLVRGRAAEKVIMVAGGIGTVPFLMLAEQKGAGLFLFGGRSRADTALVRDFKRLGVKIKISTEDGGVGRKGLVTELLAEELSPDSVVYACGPLGMLRGVAVVAARAGARCLVSLERSMACGIGVCLGCAVKGAAHAPADFKEFKMVCSDGPVFESAEIDWDRL